MKYLVLQSVHEELVDGGFVMLAQDLIMFAVKVFIFCSVGYSALMLFGVIYAQKLSAVMSPSCIAEMATAFNK